MGASLIIRDNLLQVLSLCVLIIGGYAWLRQNAKEIRAFVHDETLEEYKERL